jgi:pyruvate dehydrogenase E1 component
MPPMPEGVEEDIIAGMYRLEAVDANGAGATDENGGSSDNGGSRLRPQLFGSGTILAEVRRAARMLADDYGISSDVWSVTSYLQLRRDALALERNRRLGAEPDDARSFVERRLTDLPGPLVAATDYVKQVPDQIAPWVPGPYVTLGTDGFGRSDTRAALREHFEVSAEHITLATLHALARAGELDAELLHDARAALSVDVDKADPATA